MRAVAEMTDRLERQGVMAMAGACACLPSPTGQSQKPRPFVPFVLLLHDGVWVSLVNYEYTTAVSVTASRLVDMTSTVA